MDLPRIVSRDEWLAARKAHLKNEKSLTHMRDMVAAERRALPWVKVEESYIFEGPHGSRTLADLFDGRSQLAIYHFMWRWDLDAGCTSCSFVADHFDGANLHLAHHDVSLVAVSRAPVAKLAPYLQRMGWQFDWVSSYGNDFNFDYHVSFTKEELASGRIEYNFETIEDKRYMNDELPGISVFYKDEAGNIFHTYSSYARGLDILLGAHNLLDLTPKGRNEKRTMDWVRRHDEYVETDPATCCEAKKATAA